MTTYRHLRSVAIEESVAVAPKNLQVVSFDSSWNEIYLGTFRRDRYLAFCPNSVAGAIRVNLQYTGSEADDEEAEDEPVIRETPVITCAKWCPLTNCTILVLGSQFGVRLYDWDGSTLIYDYDFKENGIGVDDKLISGGMARGIAALGPSYVAVGIHTGTILLFEVLTADHSFVCRVVDSQRCHASPITDLASTTTTTDADKFRDVLSSCDEVGCLNVWSLCKNEASDGLLHCTKIDQTGQDDGLAATALSLWNRVGQGILVAAFASGQVRIYALPLGDVLADVSAHAAWITGMDLATQSGLLVTAAEDGFVRLWRLSSEANSALISHVCSVPTYEAVITGCKFLDPRGAAFATVAYDSTSIEMYASQ